MHMNHKKNCMSLYAIGAENDVRSGPDRGLDKWKIVPPPNIKSKKMVSVIVKPNTGMNPKIFKQAANN